MTNNYSIVYIQGILLLFLAAIFDSMFLMICVFAGLLFYSIAQIIININNSKNNSYQRPDAYNKEKIDVFIKNLRDMYDLKRKFLNNVAEDKLYENEDFNICMKIASTLATANSNKIAFQTFAIEAKNCSYNADVFLEMFDVKWKEENGIKVPKLVLKK